MKLDKILHERKIFAELSDADIEHFLRERLFRTEHLNLEFKSAFAMRSGGKYNIREFCRYVVGFSNEEGGIVVYGVADNVSDPDVPFEEYCCGLNQHPSLEDLSQWVTDRINPLVRSPAIRLFKVSGKAIMVLRVPSGVNKPYCYHEPAKKAMTFFKKTAAGVHEITPDEVRELYRTAMLEQSIRILQAEKRSQSNNSDLTGVPIIRKHRAFTIPQMENVTDYGHIGIYCYSNTILDKPVSELSEFISTHRSSFSETMRYYPKVEVFQTGVSVGYYPNTIRQDIKSTARITVYQNGFLAHDTQADWLMEGDKKISSLWLAYEIQRQLQFAKAFFIHELENINLLIDLDHISDFSIFAGEGYKRVESLYTGSHHPVHREVHLESIHDFDGSKRNYVSSTVIEAMDELSRMFGLTETPSGTWDADGYLLYVKGLEKSR